MAPDAPNVMAAESRASFAALAARLTAKAAALAITRTESAARKRRGDPARWRKARLLWPLFTGE